MRGCPGSYKRLFEHFRHVIGCGHPRGYRFYTWHSLKATRFHPALGFAAKYLLKICDLSAQLLDLLEIDAADVTLQNG
jgi:hypothetical protein